MLGFIIWTLITYSIAYTMLSWNRKVKTEEKRELLGLSIGSVIIASIIKYAYDIISLLF